MSSIQKELIREYAAAAAERICDAARDELISIRDTLSEDDRGLENAWEEICVQVQGEQSFFWDAYTAAMQDAVQGALYKLSERDQVALWLQTDEGRDWHSEQERDEERLSRSGRVSLEPEPFPIDLELISNYVVDEYLTRAAENFTNLNIECYLEGGDPQEAKERRLVECMPLDTIVTDLWDWDIRFEQESFGDIEEAAFCDEELFESFAEQLADDFERWCDEYDLDYNQNEFDQLEDFSAFVKEECLKFMKRWRANVRDEFGR